MKSAARRLHRWPLTLLCLALALPLRADLLFGPLPLRRVGINEGFTQLYIPGQLTTTTAAEIVQRGFSVVKIWPETQTPAALASVFTNPSIEVIVYRPLHLSHTITACGTTTFYDENISYGDVATELYQRYGNQPKIVVLTGWEADNQIRAYGTAPVDCDLNDWVSAQKEAEFRQLLIDRQRGVSAARNANPGAALKVYHAVEVRKVGGTNTVLNKIVSTLGADKPDLISLSAWSANSSQLPTILDTIALSSGLSHDRIFVGEWGCAKGSSNRLACYTDHSSAAFNWGVRLWIVWTYAGADVWTLIDPATKTPTSPDAFPTLQQINTFWSSLK